MVTRWIGIPREGNVGRGGVGLFVRKEYEVEEIETGVEEEGGDEGMEVRKARGCGLDFEGKGWEIF